MSDYHGHTQDLADADDAAKLFEEQARLILPHGGSGQAIWFGTTDNPEILRVDIDMDAGVAALRWLLDGRKAVELEPGQSITVLENPDQGPVTIPAELARVRAATARAAVIEYVTTGNPPTWVRWQSYFHQSAPRPYRRHGPAGSRRRRDGLGRWAP